MDRRNFLIASSGMAVAALAPLNFRLSPWYEGLEWVNIQTVFALENGWECGNLQRVDDRMSVQVTFQHKNGHKRIFTADNKIWNVNADYSLDENWWVTGEGRQEQIGNKIFFGETRMRFLDGNFTIYFPHVRCSCEIYNLKEVIDVV